MSTERGQQLGSLLTGNVDAGPTTDRYLLIEAKPDQEFSLTAGAATAGINEMSRPGEIVSFLVVRVMQAITFNRLGEPKERKSRKLRRQDGESDEAYAERAAAVGAEVAKPRTAKGAKAGKSTRGKKPKAEPGEDPADFAKRLEEWKNAK